MYPQPHDEVTVGQRIKFFRERAGLSRPVLAGLVERSAEWLKAVENGRLQTPRLNMLLKLAHALELDDLAELTGNGDAVSVEMFAGTRHAALPAVQAAITEYRVAGAMPAAPPNVEHLARRLERAWRVRHSTPDHRTQLGAVLPDLIRDAQAAVRALRGDDRRQARRVLSGVYQLADFYVAYQPAPELVWMVADRALTEGQEADDPLVAAGGAWAMVQALRESGRWDEALALAEDAIRQLQPYDQQHADWRGMAGALEVECALVHARRGRHGEAMARWETADRIARDLGTGYRHVQSSFSQPVMGAHAVTIAVDLQRPGEALQVADRFDAEAIPSLARRSRHLIEVSRAHWQRGDRHATWALLNSSERTASETIRYNGHAREMLVGLRKRPPTGLAEDVRDLCERVGVAA
ncbi:Transcriptional regulator, contains XRE-family HTH domain [Prauserella aidingensis]|uniref:helix-turn-helix domain-containing protein n=1 Tax=Prauserella aidingensis TaxID=387890 RepID=UPI0020A2F971|nr:helix-turn-helix domain-containing protein [Prauserella aidingensis]MCP2254604.1 Transcriptional regulator, contains XRE-family HTH domain [Prauserella aidingensis]